MNMRLTVKNKYIRDLYRSISDVKKGYQPRTNIVKDEKGDLVTDGTVFWLGGGKFSLSYWTYIGFSDVRQTEIHTAEPQLSEPSAFEFEMAIAGLNKHKSPGTDHIPAEVITAGSRTIRSEILKPINSIWNKEELPAEWNESIITPIYNKCDKKLQ